MTNGGYTHGERTAAGPKQARSVRAIPATRTSREPTTRRAMLMPHLKCLACKTRLQSTESPADLIGDLCHVCGSLMEPVGDLGEIVGYRVIESLDSTSHGGASRAGRLIAGRVGEILARGELEHRRGAWLGIEGCDALPVSLQVQARARGRLSLAG